MLFLILKILYLILCHYIRSNLLKENFEVHKYNKSISNKILSESKLIFVFYVIQIRLFKQFHHEIVILIKGYFTSNLFLSS